MTNTKPCDEQEKVIMSYKASQSEKAGTEAASLVSSKLTGDMLRGAQQSLKLGGTQLLFLAFPLSIHVS